MMISRLFFILLSFFIGLNIFSQNISIQSSYQYLYVPQWDKAIQTYNFSRPHLADKQDLFRHGYNINLLFDIGLEHFTPSFSYSYFNSISENSNLKVELNTRVLDIGEIHITKGFDVMLGYGTIKMSGSLRLLHITRELNDVIFNVDSNKLNVYGVGPVFNFFIYYRHINLLSRKRTTTSLKMGDVVIKDSEKSKMRYTNIVLKPFVGLGYTPFLWAPDAETILNQTYDLASKGYTSMLSFQLGFKISFLKYTK